MKKLNAIFLTILIFDSVAFATSGMIEKRAASVLTTGYVASDSIVCEDHQITVEVVVSGTPEAVTASLKPQWSTDGVTWYDEPVNVAGTAGGGEQPYTRLSKRFDFSVNSSGGVYTETFNRWGNDRYFRVAIKGGSATTTALVQIKLGTSKYAN